MNVQGSHSELGLPVVLFVLPVSSVVVLSVVGASIFQTKLGGSWLNKAYESDDWKKNLALTKTKQSSQDSTKKRWPLFGI